MQLEMINNVAWILIIGTIGMLLMVFTIIFFVVIHQRRVIKYQLELKKIAEEQQKKLTQAAVQSEETERKRISAELHDDIGALLSTAKLYLNQIQPAHLNDPSRIDILNNCKELLNDSVEHVRDLSSNLQPASIKDFGLLSTFQHFCDKLNHSPDLHISFIVQGKIDRFQTEHELAVFRILQELTNNILKYANARNIHFSFFRKDSKLQIFIEHNGNGLSQQEFEQKLYSIQGLGLKNIQNRINILRGTIRFEKNHNSMDTISLQIPIAN
jgi:two-component system, NarL family, sensor kinase